MVGINETDLGQQNVVGSVQIGKRSIAEIPHHRDLGN
jgi:hypothetical protein